MCIYVCNKYAASTISGLPFCTSWVRPIEKHLGGVLPLWSHLFPYSITPCARAAAFVVSMLLCGVPQVFSQQSTYVFQVIPSNLFLSWLTSTLRCQMSEFFDINSMVWTRLICNFGCLCNGTSLTQRFHSSPAGTECRKWCQSLHQQHLQEKGERMGYQRVQRLQGMDEESKSSFETLFFASSLHLTK